MLRVRIFAFAVACMMVAPAADAQGNRGNSNGVPGSIASVQAVVDAVLAQIAALPNFAALQAQLTALQTQLNSLSATVAGLGGLQGQINGLSGRVDGVDSRLTAEAAALNARIDAATAQLAASLDNVQAQLQAQLTETDARLDGAEGSLSTVLGDVADLKTRVIALEGATGGGDASPVIWSGGCTTPGSGTPGTFVRYCADHAEFQSSASHLLVGPSGTFQVLTPGYYRVAFWGVPVGATTATRVLVNGMVISSGVNTGTVSTTQRDLYADVIWPLQAGDVFEVQVLLGSTGTNGPLPWAPPVPPGGGVAAGSRLQVVYVGP